MRTEANSMEEFMKKYDLNFQVELRANKHEHFLSDGKTVMLPSGNNAVIRIDTQDVLGNVGTDYHVTQNEQNLKVLQAIANMHGNAWVNGGKIGKGKFYAQIEHARANLLGVDEIRSYITCTWSHNGSVTIGYGDTTVRIVCANTFAKAHADKSVSIKHTKAAEEKLTQAEIVMSQTSAIFESLIRKFEILANARMTKEYLSEFLDVVIGKEDKSTATKNKREKILVNYERNDGNPHGTIFRGTAMNAFNAVTQYHSHEMSVHGKTEAEKSEARLHSLLFGPAYKANIAGLDFLVSNAAKMPQATQNAISSFSFPSVIASSVSSVSTEETAEETAAEVSEVIESSDDFNFNDFDVLDLG